jgi:hypothetical protein
MALAMIQSTCLLREALGAWLFAARGEIRERGGSMYESGTLSPFSFKVYNARQG